MDIPPNLDTPWSLSNVVINTLNADGKELHANKEILAMSSNYFASMFFSGFVEATSNSIPVPFSYDTVKEILIIIHNLTRNASALHNRYPLNTLLELYQTADYMDFPVIRKMCTDQLLSRSSLEAAKIALSLGLQDILIEILKRIDSNDVRKFILIKDKQLLFSKAGIEVIFEKIAGMPIPRCTPSLTYFDSEDLSDSVEEESLTAIDSTKEGVLCDVKLTTKNSQGRILYSNKAVLAMVSPYFLKKFYEKDDQKVTSLDLDVEYATMLHILHIVHNGASASKLVKYDIPFLKELYFMFLASTNMNLDIPMIRALCADYLQAHASSATLDIAVKLRLTETAANILKSIDASFVLKWVVSGERNINYWEQRAFIPFAEFAEKFPIMTADREEAVLTLKEVRIVVEKLLNEYDKVSSLLLL